MDDAQEEIDEIGRSYARIWDAIEQGFAPPGGRARIDALREREAALRAELDRALADEAASVTRESVLSWLGEVAPELPDGELVRTFVSRAWLSFGEGVRVAMAFDGAPPDGPPSGPPGGGGGPADGTNPSPGDAGEGFAWLSHGGAGDHRAEPMDLQVRRRCVFLSARL